MSGRRSFAGRVARAMALVAALASTLAVVLSAVIADRLLVARDEDRLHGAVAILARELDAARTAGTSVAAVVESEDDESARLGMRLALYDRGRWAGGAAILQLPTAPGCAEVSLAGHPWRRCRIPLGGDRVAVAAADLAPARALRRGLFVAAVGALAAAVLTALAVSRASSAQIVGPLARLRDAVRAVPADAPGGAALGPPAGYDEIDGLQKAIQELLGRLDIALAQSRRFAANAAHELRTPLATMRTELDLLLEESHDGGSDDDAAGLRRALLRVRATSVVLADRAERLLVLAMPLAPGAWARDAVSVADAVRESIEALDPVRRARVKVSLDDGALVRGDATLLRLVIDNAIDNALKFAPRREVNVAVSADADNVVMRVEDHGEGVPSAERERVFEPFYRAAGVRSGAVPGYGVGLALVAHVVRAHGGTAAFDDRSIGAVLRVTLPAWRNG